MKYSNPKNKMNSDYKKTNIYTRFIMVPEILSDILALALLVNIVEHPMLKIGFSFSATITFIIFFGLLMLGLMVYGFVQPILRVFMVTYRVTSWGLKKSMDFDQTMEYLDELDEEELDEELA